MKVKVNNTDLLLLQGDITELEVDVIVNAANKDLVLGSGVAGAISKKGGPEIQKECDQIGGTRVGGAVVTSAGQLKARYIIHAVGPRLGEGNEDKNLSEATENSLIVAESKQLRELAFPAISTGIFGFPVQRCARIMLPVTYKYLMGETCLRQVCFCLFDKFTLYVFEKELKSLSSSFS